MSTKPFFMTTTFGGRLVTTTSRRITLWASKSPIIRSIPYRVNYSLYFSNFQNCQKTFVSKDILYIYTKNLWETSGRGKSCGTCFVVFSLSAGSPSPFESPCAVQCLCPVGARGVEERKLHQPTFLWHAARGGW